MFIVGGPILLLYATRSFYQAKLLKTPKLHRNKYEHTWCKKPGGGGAVNITWRGKVSQNSRRFRAENGKWIPPTGAVFIFMFHLYFFLSANGLAPPAASHSLGARTHDNELEDAGSWLYIYVRRVSLFWYYFGSTWFPDYFGRLFMSDQRWSSSCCMHTAHCPKANKYVIM